MNLNHMEGGRRLVKEIHERGLIDQVFQNDCRLQHSGTFGMSLVGLVPDQIDLLAQVWGGGVGRRCGEDWRRYLGAIKRVLSTFDLYLLQSLLLSATGAGPDDQRRPHERFPRGGDPGSHPQ